MKPRKPIKKVSTKRAKELAIYRRESKKFLAAMNFCEWPECWNKPEVVHHRNGRRGKLLNYKPFWFALCNFHHDHVHRVDPKAAQRFGILGGAGDWNNQQLVKDDVC